MESFIDGPAVEYSDGYKSYCIDGKFFSQISADGHKYSDEEMLLVLKLIMFV